MTARRHGDSAAMSSSPRVPSEKLYDLTLRLA